MLCLQDDIADPHADDAEGGDACASCKSGRPIGCRATSGRSLASAEALGGLERHVEAMRAKGHAVSAEPLSAACEHGFFLSPTLVEIGAIGDLQREVFGPVLHVLRYEREGLNTLIDAIDASGYALTGGAHSRIDAMIDQVCSRLAAGNLYVNRNIIGAVVGVQPFGGHGLSGTGPKAGGPLYLKRLLAASPSNWPPLPSSAPSNPARAWAEALGDSGRRWFEELVDALARVVRDWASRPN